MKRKLVENVGAPPEDIVDISQYRPATDEESKTLVEEGMAERLCLAKADQRKAEVETARVRLELSERDLRQARAAIQKSRKRMGVSGPDGLKEHGGKLYIKRASPKGEKDADGSGEKKGKAV